MKATGKSVLTLLIAAQAIAAPAQERTDGAQDTLSARVANLEEQMLSSQGLMEMFRQMTRLQEEIDRLRGAIEEQNHGLEQLKRRQRDLYADMDRRLQRLEGGPARPVAPGPGTASAGLPSAASPPLETLTPVIDPAGGGAQSDASLTLEVVGQRQLEPPAPGATATPTNTADAAFGASPPATAATGRLDIAPAASDPAQARAAYQRALDLLKQAQYDQSIEALRKFLLAHPRTEYADNAQYWLGEAYYANRQFGQALIEYNALLQRYPDSQKFSHAKLKLAYCYHELGQPGPAKQQLEELIQAYPDTTVAHLARDRLRRIDAPL